ncbi:nucleoside triphosphate pyrophosphohydrolase, partial [Candidatus Woesearchaeota archaeon]|nr:nucleoside triphosphate pyrophosphohydrolase [Candidatus Woesearchaeota archaeon]
VLINIIHISEVAKRENLFDLNSSLIEAKNKLIRRHPHVWGNRKCDSAEEAEAIWNEIKQKEKAGRIEK